MSDNFKILVVESSKKEMNQIIEQLNTFGINDIEYARDGEDAWQKISKTKQSNLLFNIVICNQNIPYLSGTELLLKLRTDDQYAKVPFIMLSNNGQANNVLSAIKAGTSSFIVKPFTEDTFAQKVTSFISVAS
ncbi:MAG: response regulator [Bacteriovoracaceae bacterium]|jgi:CheY-like chemotaxis protein|nr:response regulator [Bacteriovoracaceae bacterium]